MDYAYKRSGEKSFRQMIEAVEHAVRDHDYVVHTSYDIGGAVVAKGFAIRPLVIMEVEPRGDDVDLPLSLVLPCRINVYEEDGQVIVAALRPTIFTAVYPEHDLEDVAREVEQAIIGIVDDAVS